MGFKFVKTEVKPTLELISTERTPGFIAHGAWELDTYGVWSGRVFVDVSDDHGKTWREIRMSSSMGDRNFSASGYATMPTAYRMRFKRSQSKKQPRTSGNARAIFSSPGKITYL